MNGRFLFSLAFLLSVNLCPAEEPISISDFKKPENKTICAENFNSGASGWELEKNGFQVVPSVGVIGSPCLYGKCVSGIFPSAKLKIEVRPGGIYNVILHYRGKDFKVKKGRRQSVILGGVQTRDASGKTLKGQNFWVMEGTLDGAWHTFKGQITIPKDAVEDAELCLYFDWWHTGEIFYDELLMEASGSNAVIFPVSPSNLALNANGDVILRALFLMDPMPEKDIAMLVSMNGMTKLLRPESGLIFRGAFGPLKSASGAADVKLLNLKTKQIVSEHTVTYSRADGGKKVTVDSFGRILIGGKPFFPIGTFTYQHMKEEDYKRLAESGFNFVSFGIRYNNLKGEPSNSSEKMKELLSMLEKYGLKGVLQFTLMIPQREKLRLQYEPAFGEATDSKEILKAAGKSLKGNMNLLAYYLSDENPRGELPEVRRIREILASVDPTHPTLSLTNSPVNFPYFLSSGDILVYDVYPFGSQSGTAKSPDSLENADADIAYLQSLNSPFWICTQAFDWAIFRKKADEKMPTEKELTSLALLSVIHGAKGMYYYSYHEVFAKGNKVDPKHSEKMWPRIASSSKLLKKLSPYLLGTESLPALTIQNRKNTVRGRAFRGDDGKIAILLVALKPEQATAQVTLPSGKQFRSLYGRTKQEKNGQWIFASDGVDYDVLLEK